MNASSMVNLIRQMWLLSNDTLSIDAAFLKHERLERSGHKRQASKNH